MIISSFRNGYFVFFSDLREYIRKVADLLFIEVIGVEFPGACCTGKLPDNAAGRQLIAEVESFALVGLSYGIETTGGIDFRESVFTGIFRKNLAAGNFQEPVDEVIGPLYLLIPMKHPFLYRRERCHHGEEGPSHQRASEHFYFLDPELSFGQVPDHRGSSEGLWCPFIGHRKYPGRCDRCHTLVSGADDKVCPDLLPVYRLNTHGIGSVIEKGDII